MPKNGYSLRLPVLLTATFSACVALTQPSTFSASGIGGGGALFMPSISPHNNSEYYISCDMTQVFHSTDAGVNWSIMNFSQLRAYPETCVQFTSDASVLYALNNEFFPGNRRPVKSTNGGLTWSNLPSDPTGGNVYYLFADPNSTSRLLVSSYSNLYFSSNGGTSFSLVYSGSDLYIAGVFWDGTNIYVGCADGLLVSTNNGASFSLDNAGLPADFGFLGFTGAKQSGTTRLFGVARDNDDLYPTMQGSDYWGTQDVYRRDYGAGNWTLANTGIDANDFPFFAGMAQNNIDVVYVAGATQYPENPVVYKSSNGGVSWSKVLLTASNQNVATGWMGAGGDRNWGWAECALGFTVCPNNPDIAIITDFGFAHKTTNGGTSWQQVYVSAANTNPQGSNTPQGLPYPTNGLNNTASWWLLWTSANDLYAAYTDITGVRSTDGGATWKFSNSGNSFNSTYQYLKHPTNSTLYACVSSVHDMYQSTYLQDSKIDIGTGRILFSTNGGTSWSILYNFARPVISMAIDPNNTDVAYASVIHSTMGGIFKTTNLSAGASSTWTKVTNPPRTEGHPYNVLVLNDGSVVCTYSGRRTSAGAFTASSGVFYSTDGGSTWNDRSHTGMYYWTKDITIDPNDPTQNTWYVGVFSGWGGPPNGLGGVYKTTNRGINWTKISSLDRVEQIAVHPSNANILYVCTEADGLWYSSNGSAGTPTFSLVSGYDFQHPMRVFFNPFNTDAIWVTSFGNGMKSGSEAVLPVELNQWKVTPLDDRISLQWVVAREEHFAFYEMERRTNESSFVSIGKKYPSDKLHASGMYRHDDFGVLPAVDYFYRLKKVDSDGGFVYSTTLHAKLGGKPAKLVGLPTLSNGRISLSSTNLAELKSLRILDLNGKEVFRKTSTPLPCLLNLSHLPSGMYILEAEMGNDRVTERFVIAK